MIAFAICIYWAYALANHLQRSTHNFDTSNARTSYGINTRVLSAQMRAIQNGLALIKTEKTNGLCRLNQVQQVNDHS